MNIKSKFQWNITSESKWGRKNQHQTDSVRSQRLMPLKGTISIVENILTTAVQGISMMFSSISRGHLIEQIAVHIATIIFANHLVFLIKDYTWDDNVHICLIQQKQKMFKHSFKCYALNIFTLTTPFLKFNRSTNNKICKHNNYWWH